MSGRPREFKDMKVIEAAMDVFWVKGFDACSTEDLCKSTGLGKGSLYNAFGSKHNLYKQALLRYIELGLQAQLEILEHPGPIKDRLRTLMEWVIDTDLNDPDRRGCLSINAAMERGRKDPEIARAVRHHFARLEQALCHVLALGQRSGEITSKRPALELARFFRSSYYGLRVLTKVEQDRDALLDVVEGTLAAL
ncbi:TetR family transcriptional regulator [Bacillus sp. SA1-12]|uniref:TetR/AcrR family transcriptional regulator n=1 Tax=Bacillus sp. SA1-12 TaxID=1455638 RepID=UPI00062639D7|nr:TetR/AcrR family transcriptional regulator [Bacillus sp. SA1-12]KKI92795.1 TetR family transcriptional regulator [Bacillus sp. SA1-12]